MPVIIQESLYMSDDDTLSSKQMDEADAIVMAQMEKNQIERARVVRINNYEAAEKEANNVQKRTSEIQKKWNRMSKEGVLYPSAERKVDSDRLEEASKKYQTLLDLISDN